MFLALTLCPVIVITNWILPFLGTIYCRKQPQRWIGYWLLTMILSWTLFPFLRLILQEEMITTIQIVTSVILILLVNIDRIKMLLEQVDKVLTIVKTQYAEVKNKVCEFTKQHGLCQ